MAIDLGDVSEDVTIHFLWDTVDGSGASITRAVNGEIRVYKDSGTPPTTSGIIDIEDFDSLVGIHACTIALDAATFYSVGSDYNVVLSGAVIDSQVVSAVLAHFSIENRFTGVGAAQISDAVWDEALADHQLSGSTGQALALADIVADPIVVADAVWDENLNEHQLSGSMGQALGLADVITDVGDIADAVWDENLNEHQLSGSMGQALAQAQDPAPIPPTVIAIADQVWDESLGEHQLSGSMGQALGLGLAGAIADVAAIADAVWDEGLSDHQLSGSTGQALGLADAVADVNAIADQVWDEALTGHLTAGSMGATLSNATQTGTGNILVDHNFGGTDNLRVTDSSSGAGIDEVTVQAFLKTDFDAGNKGAAFVKGGTLTGSDGRWLNPLALDADTYTISFNKPAVFVGSTTEITVS